MLCNMKPAGVFNLLLFCRETYRCSDTNKHYTPVQTICFISTWLIVREYWMSLTQLPAAPREITLCIFNNGANLLDNAAWSCFDVAFFFFQDPVPAFILTVKTQQWSDWWRIDEAKVCRFADVVCVCVPWSVACTLFTVLSFLCGVRKLRQWTPAASTVQLTHTDTNTHLLTRIKTNRWVHATRQSESPEG